MPSEVAQNESKLDVETKEIVQKIDTEEFISQETKIEGEERPNDKFENSKEAKKTLENENKENEEPSVEDIESQKKLAEELLSDGKRHLIVKDFQAAVDVLSDACSLLEKIYGNMAEECAEAYFKYGCALLELSKDQISPVGLEEKDNEEVSVQEENLPETDDDEENKSIISHVTDEVQEKSTEKEEELSEESTPAGGDELEEKSTEKDEKLSEENIIPADEGDKLEEKSTEKEEMSADEENPDEEDINDLQLAWEVLDLAKVIYKNKDTEESKLKLAEVLMKCGEVSIEDEKFEMAIEDITECLAIQRLLLPEDSRIIAETLFQLGLAHELGGSGERAIELLNEAVAVLGQRIKTLKNSTEDNDKVKEELAEVESIIPEIQDRIVDIKERKKAAVDALLAAVGAVSNEATTNGGTSTTTKQASNISHLVRKRPKEGETDGTPSKVPKLEESTASKQ